VRERFSTEQKLSDQDRAAIIAIAAKALKRFQPVPEPAAVAGKS
jgi:hypothetical protein